MTSTATNKGDLKDLKKDVIKATEHKMTEDITNWTGKLYNDWILDETTLFGLYDLHKYEGFNKEDVLRSLKEIGDKYGNGVIIEVIIVCALKGPAKAATTQLSSGRTIASLGIPKSSPKGTKGISCNRINAATADLAAYYMKILDVPKKIDSELPGWLQFPSAASIDLPERYKKLHREFAELFSVKIGGEFNEDIYLAMQSNKYLNKSLRLFD